MRTTAAVTEGPKGPFVLREVELVPPRPDEVVVRIHASGLCHTDLAHRDGWGALSYPAVLGHEGAGVVVATGADVRRVAPGDRVVLSYYSCRTCANCRRDRPAYCTQTFAGNFAGTRPDGSRTVSLDGQNIASAFFGQSSFALHALANINNVVKVADDLPLCHLAPLGCGFQTGAGAILNSLGLQLGQSVAVFGTGAVGMAAIMAAKAVGAHSIVAVDLDDSRLALASELGADQLFRGDQPDLAKAIRRATRGGVDGAVECVGSAQVLQTAFAALAVGGACVMLGLPPRGAQMSVDMGALLSGRRLIGSIEGDADPLIFIPQLMDMHRAGRFPFERLLRFYPFEAINEAAADMESGQVIKPVLLMPEDQAYG